MITKKLYMAFVLAMAMVFMVTTGLMAQSGCPNVTDADRKESDIVGAYFTIGGNQANYYFGSLVDRSPTGGVPGLIKYCVYPSVGPTTAGTVYPNWKLLGLGGDPEFAFGHPKGDPTNIPLDGTGGDVGIHIGYADWYDGVPTEQTILLHINDSDECDNLYGGNPGTCWVFPTRKWPPQNGEDTKLNVIKFYDANADGINNDGQLIEGWKISINDDINYTPYSEFVEPGEYTVTEFSPIEANWISTTPNPVYVTLAEGDVKTVEFGNYCLVPGGGKTLGFWSNKNGQVVMNDGGTMEPELGMLRRLNLRSATGANFDPTTYTLFRTWLLSATATNMAYMLSAQLAAMALNVEAGFVDPNAFYIPYGGTVGALITAADAALMNNGYTPAGDPNRSSQEMLKDHLDALNNGANVIPPTPCAFSFATE